MQNDKLKKELELQQKEKGSLVSGVAEAEKKILVLNSELEKVSLFLEFDGFMSNVSYHLAFFS